MRQLMYETKSRRRDRHDDVINVGTSRGASRKNKSRGEPIDIPSNKDEERPHKSHSISRIARMNTSQASRLPERGKASVVIENANPSTSRRDRKKIDNDDDNDDVIEIGSDDESKSTKPKRRRLRQRISDDDDDEEDEYIPPPTTSSFFKPSQTRRRTLHSPLGNFTARKDRLPTLSESVAKTSEYHGVKSIFSDDEDDLYSNIKKRSLSAKKKREKELDDLFDYPPKDDPKPSSPVILPYDPIDDYEIQPVDTNEEHYLTFPFKAKKSVTVFQRDYERLDDDTYLNDTLMDVFPKIWADEFPDASIYTFSSFFFTKLSGPHNTMHYDTVKRWTANEDIFKKKFLIIPIAQHNHWFLIVVMNPGYCIQGEKGQEYHPDFMDEDVVEIVSKKTKKKSKEAGTPLDPTKPYVVLLDPLHLNKPGAAKLIMRYLKEEAIQKLNIDSTEFMIPEVVKPACPGQDNFTDCGVFCLHYMKSLYQYTDDMMTTLYKNAAHDEEAWDKDHTLPGFRTHLKRMLKRKMKEYREYMLDIVQ